MNVEGKRFFNSQYMKDEEGRLLQDDCLKRERWVRWFNEPLYIKSPTPRPDYRGRTPGIALVEAAG